MYPAIVYLPISDLSIYLSEYMYMCMCMCMCMCMYLSIPQVRVFALRFLAPPGRRDLFLKPVKQLTLRG